MVGIESIQDLRASPSTADTPGNVSSKVPHYAEEIGIFNRLTMNS
jgi:hypothetical protein